MEPKPHLVHVFPTFQHGGSAVRTCAIANRFADRFRHTFLSLHPGTEARGLLLPEVEAQAQEVRGGGLGAPLRLGRAIATLRPDLLLTYNWGSMDAVAGARLAAVRPHLHTEDGFNPEEADGQKRRRVFARRLLLRGAHGVVVPSHVLERIATESWRVPAGRVHLVPNGIDTARFAPGEAGPARARFGFDPEDGVVGTVAYLRPVKNLPLLVRAFARAARDRRLRLLVVGEGPDRDALRDLARDLGVGERARFPGLLPDPVDAYRAMDVFALSSSTEQMPISVLEAMGAELPVLSTDVGDVRHIVAAPNHPYVIPLADEEGYVRALERLLDDRAERARVGAANRERCGAEYAEERMFERYLRLYERALGNPAGGPT